MAENSKIEWTSNTFNHVRGCTKVSAGCANCYAETMSGRNPKTLGIWGPNGTRVVASESQWKLPLKWDKAAATGVCHACFGRGMLKKETCVSCMGTGKEGDGSPYRARVFCASLADVFEDWKGPMTASDGDELTHCGSCGREGTMPIVRCDKSCPECGSEVRSLTMQDVRARLFRLIDATPNLDWLLLTKRPENIAKLMPAVPAGLAEYVRSDAEPVHPIRPGHYQAFRPNVWLGTSVENQEAADKRIPHLLRAPAVVRFLSCEPLLGPVDIQAAIYRGVPWQLGGGEAELHWVIVGGESGHGARPMHPDWARSIRDQCQAAGVAFFMKQWGEYAPPDQVPSGVFEDRKRFEPYQFPGLAPMDERGPIVYRVGKKAAGALLDGREWREFPACKPL